MDPDQFLAGITPSAKRTKLTPHSSDIAKLRDAGCSLQQICDYLSHLNVSIKPSGLAKFISKGLSASSSLPAKQLAAQTSSSIKPITSPTTSDTPPQTNEKPDTSSDDIKTIEQLRAEFPTMPRMQLVRKYSAQYDRPIKNRFLEPSPPTDSDK
jgi:hypothetical protein